MSELETKTRYDAAEAEPRILRRWLESGLFHPEPEGTADENYSIAVPPPNVTGALHMGHALNGSIQDALIRFNRARGTRAKWIAGTDHAGIATQKQVERRLRGEGTSREEVGREAFTERVWQWREQYGNTIIGQFQRLGASLDYDDERFTLDERYVEAVLKVFVDLYEKGLIYRDNYMVNWDPGSRSAISDLEVEDREVVDTLFYVDYPLASGNGSITVATVRPETMLADTAIAVNPNDERYARLIGEEAVLPLVGRRLKIIADDYVKPEFGTGALKITPGHDPNDFEIGRRHGLEELTVIGEDGRMTQGAGERFAGLRIKEAQDAIVAALREEGALARTEEYPHVVPFSHRSGERIEPLISLQWFMRMDELAQPAIDAVKDGRVRIHPERWTRVYLDWMENIRPWCVSRQLWWGHQIPVWYRGDETYVGTTAPEGDGWERDPDVLDTWFSSALWPFATLGWPQQTPELRAFYPTDVLSTARDILFLWVARMIMMGLEFVGEIPFRDVYIHSVIQAPDGRRMSKSLGTGIDPLDEIGQHGADGVRFGLLAMSSSQDVRYSAEKVQQGQQLANKLWNASRLILTRVSDAPPAAAPKPRAVEDRWILSRLARTQAEVEERIEAYDFSHAVLALYDFVYGELCDWYLELVKPRLYEAEGEERTDLEATLLHVLTETLQLAHPVIPFVTEEIWSHVPGAKGLLAARQTTPADASAADPGADRAIAEAIEAVQALRGWRDSVGAPAGARIPARIDADGYGETAAHVARLSRLELSDPAEFGEQPVAQVAIPGGAVAIFASDAVDLGAAERKLAERRKTLEAEIKRCEGKLSNDGFVAKAPPAVVDAEREKLASLREELAAL
ncbi:valine--tRNA ligase [Conexibacter sp. JD483]|uniref:valine--tRNA ligase n=1 Tax=unclassified Conexibacter TaxID=2627773 RepID=UPI00272830B3|nr:MULTISPECIES: valine--tRNA ligase [unclassified Conexibacter]MDO8187636.1 valine--tRNA ligase [Conexibacter sp. CPCC 205706]MDO8201032.1 valine--tRNA ligase [Conexibacter sp. CPCC 205762]MDR9371205.1 valine--tRNA ligase [Conexibacter sp. JD483]